MIGGRGWDNSDYLSGLSGDEEDRQKAKEDYEEFSERRQAFMDRQQKIMETLQGQAFLDQGQEMKMGDDSMPMPMPDEEILNVEPGSGGGSRMAQMMAQAEKMKEMKERMKTMGLEQKLAVPLEDEDEEAPSS